MGRFISEDSVADDPNLYGYCGGNPVNNIDPTGHVSAPAIKLDISISSGFLRFACQKIPGLGLVLEGWGLVSDASDVFKLEEEIPPPPKEYTNEQKAQYYLSKMGFDTGGIDGIMGAKSSSALIIFQYSQGLTVTGEVDGATLAQFEKCANDRTSYQSIMYSKKMRDWKPEKPTVDENEKNGKLNEANMARVPTGNGGNAKLNKEAAVSWAMMVNDAIEYNKTAVDKLNINEFALSGEISGYRSYEQQVKVRTDWKNKITNAYNSSENSDYKTMVQQLIDNGISKDQAIIKITGIYSANPGFSNHGLAIAADLRFVKGSNSYNWMKNNASKYGFKPYAAEHWHWDYKP